MLWVDGRPKEGKIPGHAAGPWLVDKAAGEDKPAPTSCVTFCDVPLTAQDDRPEQVALGVASLDSALLTQVAGPLQSVVSVENSACEVPHVGQAESDVIADQRPPAISPAPPVVFSSNDVKVPAFIHLSGLDWVHDGHPKQPVATTTPPGLGVKFIFRSNGAPVAKLVRAGTYSVEAMIDDANFLGTANATLVIRKATVPIQIDGLDQGYNGSPIVVTAKAPGGLIPAIHYSRDGKPVSRPIAAGSYQVTAHIESVNCEGRASATLVVRKAQARLTIESTSKVFDASAHSARCVARGVETPEGSDLTSFVSLFYEAPDGSVSSVPPQHAGKYAVMAAFAGDENHAAFERRPTGKWIIIEKAAPEFLELSEPSVARGRCLLTVSGRIAAGSLIPPGAISITINGVTHTAPIKPGGVFSATAVFQTQKLPAGSYAVEYAYVGSANFRSAFAQRALTIRPEPKPVRRTRRESLRPVGALRRS